MTLQEYCIENQKTELLAEWDNTQNAGENPNGYAVSSHQKVWWRCRQGHIWQAAVADRTKNLSGCPYCSGKLPIPGVTDLVTLYPELAAQWHPTRNGELQPGDFTAGSERKVWWQCEEGHEWQALIENRARKGQKCPYCTGKRAWPGYNDLATLYPELMKEWFYEYNRSVDPTKLRPGSRKRVWWRCAEGHVWETYLFNRTTGKKSGCPYCAGNAKSAKPHLGKEEQSGKREGKTHGNRKGNAGIFT